MPRTAAEGGGSTARRNLKLALAIALVTNGGMIVVFGLTSSLLLNQLFGAGYERAAPALFVIGIGMLFFALCHVLNAHATGSGAPKVQGMAITFGLIAAIAEGPFLTVQYAMLGASLSFAFGTGAALLVVAFWSWRYVRSHYVRSQSSI